MTERKKRKPRTVWLVLGILALVAVNILVIYNARVPMPTEEDIEAAVREYYREDIEEIRETCGLTDLSLELEFVSLDIRKPTLFKEGLILAKVKDYFVCSDLDSIEYDLETQEKYSGVLSWIRSPVAAWRSGSYQIEWEDYEAVYVSSEPGHFVLLMDTQGNTYNFKTDLYTYSILRNGQEVFKADSGYTGPDQYTAGSSSRKICKQCGREAENLSNGYCKVCVDTYHTDYYIGADGEVHADRPY